MQRIHQRSRASILCGLKLPNSRILLVSKGHPRGSNKFVPASAEANKRIRCRGGAPVPARVVSCHRELHTSHFTLPMIRFLKWFFPISLAVLIVLVASAYWYVTPQRLKTIVQPHLSSALGREVMFDRIEWGLSDGVVFSEFASGRSGWCRSLFGCGAGTGTRVAERVVVG